jgi:hypothetical protein
MIDAIRVNIVRGSRSWKSMKVKVFFCPNNFINHYCIACIDFDGFLLRMTSLF